jgi:outer membrane receptor for ferrienterochelin and colicin
MSVTMALGILAVVMGQISLAEEAKEEAPPTYKLGEVVVAATKSEVKLKDVPANVTVVTKEEIEGASIQNVDDLLENLAGIEGVQRYTGIAYTIPISVFMRGIKGAHRVLVMIDGIPLNDSLNGFVNWNEISLDAVERVEIVRGPFSSLYGSNAMAGVINIITKKVEEGFKAEIKPNLGNYEYSNYGVNLSVGMDRLSYSLVLNKLHNDNYLFRDSIIEEKWDRTVPPIGGFVIKKWNVENFDTDDLNLIANVNAKIGERSEITFSGGYFDCESGMGKTEFLYTSNLPEKDNKSEKKYYRLNLIGKTLIGDNRISFITSYHHAGNKYWGENYGGMTPEPYSYPYYVPTLMEYDSDDSGLELRLNRALGKKHLLTLGMEGRLNKGQWSLINTGTGQAVAEKKMDKSADTEALYIQDEISQSQKLRFILGARLDYHSEFGSAFSPKLSMLYRFSDKTRIHTSVGQAFNAPTLGQLYQPEWMRIPMLIFRSNPDLDPEKVTSYEFGFEHTFTEKVLGKLTLFRNDTKDLIDLETVKEPTGTEPGIEQYGNIEKTYSQGVETELEALILPGLTGYLNHTYLEAEDKQINEALDYTPHNRLNLGLRFSKDFGRIRLRISPQVRYVSSQYTTDRKTDVRYKIDDYFISDLNFMAKLRENIELFLTCKNLTNEKIEDERGLSRNPGRNYWFSTRVEF